MTQKLRKISALATVSFLALASFEAAMAASAQRKGVKDAALAPASKFDMSHWKITLPIDLNKDKKADEITVKQMKKYSHPDYFYLDAQDNMVFTSPNKGTTTANTSNARSELRYMLRGTNTRIKTHSGANNFAVKARKDSNKFGSIGGKMEATLKVDHVALRAGNASKKPAHSVVVGQIHATKYDNTSSGFGYGNEPLKIYYKKFPHHNTGSVFWNYELNLAKDDPKRKDIAYPVWGNTWENPADPGAAGVALGEEFSYTVNVHENIMYLTFESPNRPTVKYSKSLVSQHDAYGKTDPNANKYAYGGDTLYYKAGVYNQCSTANKEGLWYTGCAGTGVWAEDKANGDYAQASFSRLVVGESTPPAE